MSSLYPPASFCRFSQPSYLPLSEPSLSPVFQPIDVSHYLAGLLSYLFIVYTFFEDHIGNKYTLMCFYVLSAAIHLITPNVNFLGTGLNAFSWSTKSNTIPFSNMSHYKQSVINWSINILVKEKYDSINKLNKLIHL